MVRTEKLAMSEDSASHRSAQPYLSSDAGGCMYSARGKPALKQSVERALCTHEGNVVGISCPARSSLDGGRSSRASEGE